MNLKQIAIISIGINLALAGTVALLVTNSAPPVIVQTNAVTSVIEKRIEVPVRVAEAFDWRKVESEDYRQYIANLRSIGCPEQTVRDIIVADVNALFEARRQAIVTPKEEFKFWKPGELSVFGTAQARRLQGQFAQLRELAEEKRAILRELLGIDLPERLQAVSATLNPREQLLAFLPADKRLKVEEIEQRYAAMLMQKTTDSSGAEQLGNYKKLQVEKEAEITALLTPEEFDEYEMRLSPSANALRAKLGNLNPTAEEFRALVRLRKQFDEQFGDFLAYNPADPSAREKRAQAEHDLNEQMRAVVGVDRWSAYQREQDAGFQGAAQAAERAGLAPELAANVYEIKNIALREVARVQNDKSLPTDDRQSTLAEVQGAVEEAILKVLGRKGFEAYLKQPGSAWLQHLTTRPAMAASE